MNGIVHLERSEKQSDRVEISPEILSLAAVEAEVRTRQTGRPTSVIGWYHSHPHMTCVPSHVDLQYQADYQMLDEGFIGLIFSVYNSDAQHKNRVQVHAWQSVVEEKQNIEIPDFRPGMTEEEIIALSEMEANARNAGFAEHQVPIEFYDDEPGKCDLYERIVQLMRIFWREEKHVYHLRCGIEEGFSTPSGFLSPSLVASASGSAYSQLHHAAVFQKTCSRLLESLFVPLKRAYSNLIDGNLEKIADLEREETELLASLN